MTWGMWVALMVMLGLIIGAFAIPTLYYQDEADPDVSAEQRGWLKTQETLGYKVHPLFFQVIEAKRTGPTRYEVEGTVVWRTLFGVDVGHRYELDAWRWLAVWTTFVLVELALGVYVVTDSSAQND